MSQNKKNTKGRPSYLQIQYLIELEKIGNQRGCVLMVADACGVSHGTVSRFFKACCDNGELTENYSFTEKGRKILKMYKRLLKDIEEYLYRIGSKENEIPELTRELLENVDYNFLVRIIRNDQSIRRGRAIQEQVQDIQNVLGNVLRKGNYEVSIAVYRADTNNKISYSMAHRGFERPAIIRVNKRGNWLELTTCLMKAKSRIDGEEKEGKMDSLKYFINGELTEARIKDGKVRVPLEACQIQKSSKGNIKGVIPITVTCSVGNRHMPESTAYLMFWL